MEKRSYDDLRPLFEARFPAVFTPRGSLPIPLAIGCFEEISSAMEASTTHTERSFFMAVWTRRPEYQAALAAGGARYAPDGSADGRISEEESGVAYERFLAVISARFLGHMVAGLDDAHILSFVPEAVRNSDLIAQSWRMAEEKREEAARRRRKNLARKRRRAYKKELARTG